MNQEQICQIEELTRSQRDTEMWMEERRKQTTASNVGSLAKMKVVLPVTKRAKKILYSRFTGSKATRYGCTMEEVALREYTAYQQHGHPGIKTESVGLGISTENLWLAVSPDSTLKCLLSGCWRYGYACKPCTCCSQIDAGSTHFYKTKFVVQYFWMAEIAQMVSSG